MRAIAGRVYRGIMGGSLGSGERREHARIDRLAPQVAEKDEAAPLGDEQPLGELDHVVVRHRLDVVGDLADRDVAAVVDLVERQAFHAMLAAVEAEENAALELALRARELVRREAFAPQERELV